MHPVLSYGASARLVTRERQPRDCSRMGREWFLIPIVLQPCVLTQLEAGRGAVPAWRVRATLRLHSRNGTRRFRRYGC